MLKRAVLIQLSLALLCGLLAGPVAAADGLVLVGMTKSPSSHVLPGSVLVLRARVGNPGPTRAEGLLAVRISGVAALQSGRRVAVDAGAQELLDIYVYLPDSLSDQEAIDIEASLRVTYGGREVVGDRQGVPSTYSLRLPVERLSSLPAVAMQAAPKIIPAWYWPPAPPHGSYEMAVASRIDAGQGRQSVNFDESFVPLNQSEWDAIDQLIVSEPRFFEDAAVVESMRRFLTAGGRVWVMLDDIPSESLRPLLGAGQACETVDAVELSEVVIEISGPRTDLSEADRTITSDDGLVLKRVLQSGGRVTHSVDGWPAAVSMPVGHGELVITTLESRAWITPRQQQRSSDPRFQSPFGLYAWGNMFAQDVNTPRLDPPLNQEVSYPLEFIGNPVVPRGWVALALVGFCLVLAAVGGWRMTTGDLSRFGWQAPLLAVATGAGLLFASLWIRSDTPESVSRLQLVTVGEQGDFALVREQAAVYLERTAAMQLQGEVDGLAVPSESSSSGLREFVAGDFQQWQLGNQAWPPGSWRYQVKYTADTHDLVVPAQLTADGVRLQWPSGLTAPLEDPVLAYVPGDPLLCTPSKEGLRVDGRTSVDGERWIAGSLMSDEQQRRLEIYREYFRPDAQLQRPARQLYGWSPPWPGPSWDRELVQYGSALVALPVRLERPAVGSEVWIPHGLIQLRKNPQALGASNAFRDATGSWVDESTIGTEARLQFVLPSQVLPFAAQTLELDLDIRAPHRLVTLSAETTEGSVELARLNGPSLPWSQRIDDPAVLKALRDGVLDITLKVSERTDVAPDANSSSIVAWQVDHLHASLRGHVEAQSKLSQP